MKQVNMCQGSKNKKLATNQSTYVLARETMRLKKIGVLEYVETLKSFSILRLGLDLTVKIDGSED